MLRLWSSNLIPRNFFGEKWLHTNCLCACLRESHHRRSRCKDCVWLNSGFPLPDLSSLVGERDPSAENSQSTLRIPTHCSSFCYNALFGTCRREGKVTKRIQFCSYFLSNLPSTFSLNYFVHFFSFPQVSRRVSGGSFLQINCHRVCFGELSSTPRGFSFRPIQSVSKFLEQAGIEHLYASDATNFESG